MGLARFQKWLWLLLDDPSSSRKAKVVSIFIMLIIAVSVIGFTLESVPVGCRTVDKYVEPPPVKDGKNVTTRSYSPRELCPEPDQRRSPYYEIEYFCIMVFTVEYALRIFASPAGPGVCRFVIQPMNIIDLLAILPFYVGVFSGSSGLEGLAVLRVLRLTRVLRVFKMSRNFQGLVLLMQTFRKSAAALLMLVFFVAMSLIVCATLMYYFEMGDWDEYRQQYVRPDGEQTPFESIPASMWWCIVTMTTVGYGDDTPITLPGRILAIFTMFCGLIVLSLPITIIGANFDELYRDSRRREQEARAARKLRKAQPNAKHPGSVVSDAAVYPEPIGRKENHASKPMRLIQELVNESHAKLYKDVEALMHEQERELRLKVKEVLAEFAGSTTHADAHLERVPERHEEPPSLTGDPS